MLFYIAQGVGFLGMLLAFISFQQNDNKQILKFQTFAALTFMVHFFMLGALTGAVMNILGATRNIIFYHRDKAWANKKLWLYLFVCLFAISGVLTWNNVYSILPVFGMMIATVGLWVKNPKLTRLFIFPSSPCWLIYNVISGSVAGVLTESFVLTSLTIAFIRFDILKQKSGAETQVKQEQSVAS